jgi:hypothetical protein
MPMWIALLVLVFGHHSALSAIIPFGSAQRLSLVDQVNTDFLDLFSRQIDSLSQTLDLPLSTDARRMSDLIAEFSPRSRSVFLNVAMTGTPAGMTHDTKALEMQSDLLREWLDMNSLDKRNARIGKRYLISRDFIAPHVAPQFSPVLAKPLHDFLPGFVHDLRIYFMKNWSESEDSMETVIPLTLAKLEQEKNVLPKDKKVHGLILEASHNRARQIMMDFMEGHLQQEQSTLDQSAAIPSSKKEQSLRRVLENLIDKLKHTNSQEPIPYLTPPVFNKDELDKFVKPNPLDPALQAQMVTKGFLKAPMIQKILIHIRKNAKVLCGGWVLKLGFTLIFLAVSAATLSSGEILQGSE